MPFSPILIEEKACEIFIHHPHLHKRKVHCRATDKGSLVIEGEVHSFFEKQLAQEALREFDEVDVENNLRVVDR